MGKSKKEKQQAYFFDNKALLALILPLVVEQLLAVLVGMADSIMIASVGEAAVSGVSLVDQIMVLLINAFAALATGGAVVAGQFLGQDRKEEACKSATQMVWFITIYKVWTQESFPVEARASMQGFINGFSRFCCGLFALVTPYLVAGDRIHTTMYGFAGIVLISAIAGTRMIMLQKKHGVGQM